MAVEIVLEGAMGGAGFTLQPMLWSTALTAARIPLAAWLAGALGVSRDLVGHLAHRRGARRRDGRCSGAASAGGRCGYEPRHHVPHRLRRPPTATSAEMKGAVLRALPSATLVDVTHGVAPGDVASAAYLLARTMGAFPEGTVHVVVVDPGVGIGAAGARGGGRRAAARRARQRRAVAGARARDRARRVPAASPTARARRSTAATSSRRRPRGSPAARPSPRSASRSTTPSACRRTAWSGAAGSWSARSCTWTASGRW